MSLSSASASDSLTRYTLVYHQLASCPDISSASLLSLPSASPASSAPSASVVSLTTTQRSIENNTKRDITRHITLPHPLRTTPSASSAFLSASFSASSSDSLITLPSPSGSLVFIARKGSSASNDVPSPNHSPSPSPNVVLEVTNRTGRVMTTTRTSERVIVTGLFGSCQWDQAERFVVFTAQCDAEATTSVSALLQRDKERQREREKEKASRLGQHDYEEEWGEAMNGIKSPQPFLFVLPHFDQADDLATISPTLFPVQLPFNCKVSVGQVQLLPSFDASPSDGTAAVADMKLFGTIKTASTITKEEESFEAVAIAWNEEPRRFGALYYNTRQSTLIYMRIALKPTFKSSDAWTRGKVTESDASDKQSKDKHHRLIEMRKLTDTEVDYAVMSPRFSPDGRWLIFLSAQKTWAHMSGSRLRRIDWFSPNKEITTVIDVISCPATIDSFPGLYTPSGMLPVWTWCTNEHIVLSTQWRCRERVLVIHVLDKRLIEIALPIHLDQRLENGSMSVLCARDESIVLSASSLCVPPSVFAVRLYWSETSDSQMYQDNAHTEQLYAQWTRLSEPQMPLSSSVRERVEKMKFEIVHVQPDSSYQGYTALPFDAILVWSDWQQIEKVDGLYSGERPVIRKPPLHLLCCIDEGHAFLLVNYRGSTAYGQDMLMSLPGHCGDMDVRDCMKALDAVRQRPYVHMNTNLVGVMGGSHGGFLVTHLIGQHPDVFYCATTRNPVVNCAAMANLSDIPDWSYFEMGVEYNPVRGPKVQDYARLLAASPIAHIDRVKTPILFLLGTADKRVPHQPTIDYYRILKARGIKTRLLLYPNAQHGLTDSVAQEADMWINTALFMQECRMKVLENAMVET